MIDNVKQGKNCKIYPMVNLYGCELGNDVMVANFVEIQSGVKIGDRSRISSHSFVCSGVTIENDCFIGHSVTFANDKYPAANADYDMKKILVRQHASIGNSAVVLPGITIGESSIIGAGAVVVKDVPPYSIVVGNPGKVIRSIAPTSGTAVVDFDFLFKEAIRKAVKNGFIRDNYENWHLLTVEETTNRLFTYYREKPFELLFDHSFNIALWGNTKNLYDDICPNCSHMFGGYEEPTWQFHIKQMVLGPEGYLRKMFKEGTL